MCRIPNITNQSKKHVDPRFIDYPTYNYQLDTLSPAKDAGLGAYGELVPFDLKNVSRISDSDPDLGAYERIEKTKENGKKKIVISMSVCCFC
jgi:hypothetical protein